MVVRNVMGFPNQGPRGSVTGRNRAPQRWHSNVPFALGVMRAVSQMHDKAPRRQARRGAMKRLGSNASDQRRVWGAAVEDEAAVFVCVAVASVALVVFVAVAVGALFMAVAVATI